MPTLTNCLALAAVWHDKVGDQSWRHFISIVMAGIIAYVAFSCYLLMTDQMEQIIGRKYDH